MSNRYRMYTMIHPYLFPDQLISWVGLKPQWHWFPPKSWYLFSKTSIFKTEKPMLGNQFIFKTNRGYQVFILPVPYDCTLT